ncbi:alpha/beta fold hydrolase [Sinosporangium siamense]|uniref:Peptidase n=1 Tax=Sinosporangium siamense TaxID=1367973 RepID=A0A919RNV4_9ACTN|nr:alpha/beta fold hydrolase [Sinosporangium siamense]GII97013.1 peptidase [Sinosporangium siamense]
MATPRWRAALALAGLLTLFACGTQTSTPRQKGDGISWTPCRVTGQPVRECGEVSVPVDWSEPAGPRIDIAISRIPATDRSRRIGVLFYNPGGPEAQGVYVPTLLWPTELTRRFDIIGFDPRGVGRSSRVDCGPIDGAVAGIAKLPSLSQVPDVAAVETAARTYVRKCEQKVGLLLGRLGSRSVARDIDEIRRALGEERINLWMHSYGSIIGQAYLANYPRHVRAALLTGAVDTAVSGVDYTLQTHTPTQPPKGPAALTNLLTANLRQSLAGFAPWCRAHPRDCAIHQDPIGQSVAVARVERPPVPGQEPLYRTLLDAAWASALNPEDWGRYGFSVAEAQAGRPGALERLADEGVPADVGSAISTLPSNALLLGVLCTDFRWSGSVPQVLKDYQNAGGDLPQTPSTASQFVTCGVWPRTTPPLGPLRAEDAARPLIVVGEDDRHNLVSWAETVAGRFNAGLLVVKDTGPAVVGASVPCADQAAVAYLVDGRFPETRTCSP